MDSRNLQHIMAKSKAPKPTQTRIGIDSDEEEKAPRLKGAARGLSKNNVIASSTTLSVNRTKPSSGSPSTAASWELHLTRAARQGKRTVNYDTKFHPMPNSAAVHRRSNSVSFPSQLSDDESEQSSLTLSGSSRADSENEDGDEDEISSDSPVHQVTPMLRPRKLDLRALRHSPRAAAQKPTNYSKKHQPQDYGLSGHCHGAIIMLPPLAQSELFKPPEIHRKRKAFASVEPMPGSDDDDENAIESSSSRLSDVDDDEHGMFQETPTGRPLRSFDPNSSRPTKKRRRSDGKSNTAKSIISRQEGKRHSPQISISSTRSSDISSIDTDEVHQLADALAAANDSTAMPSSLSATEPQPSSVTLEGTASPIPSKFILTVVRPYFDIRENGQPAPQLGQPQGSAVTPEDSVSVRHTPHPTTSESRTGGRATSELRQGTRASSDESMTTMLENYPQTVSEVYKDSGAASEPGSNIEAGSQTLSERCDADANHQIMNESWRAARELKPDSSTMQRAVHADVHSTREQRAVHADVHSTREQRAVEADSQVMSDCSRPTSEQTEIEVDFRCPFKADQPSSSHFEEAMVAPEPELHSPLLDGAIAVIEQAIADDSDDEQISEEMDEQNFQLSVIHAVALREVEADAVSSEDPDPIDLLPKPSSCYSTTDSLPSTAEPDSGPAGNVAVSTTMYKNLSKL